MSIESHRRYLLGVALRILGNSSDAEDATQEALLRLAGAPALQIGNPRAWLTTIIGRICIDMLRVRRSRREEPLDADAAEHQPGRDAMDAETEALLVDSVGIALMVALERLDVPERVAFVLHDIFDVPFDMIAPMLARSPAATRQLASRARRRVRGGSAGNTSLEGRRMVIEAFLAASREGNFEALVALLDRDASLQIDPRLLGPGMTAMVHGPDAVGRRALLGKGRKSQVALINGDVGILVAEGTRLALALLFTLQHGRILHIELVADPIRLRALRIAVLSVHTNTSGGHP